VVVICTGVISGAMAEPLIGACDPMLERATATMGRPVPVFADALGVAGYDTEFRVRTTEWNHRCKDKTMSAVHVLTRSKLVAMGVSIAKLVVGFVHASMQEEKFDADLRALGIDPRAARAPIAPSSTRGQTDLR
jgi:hypothetical protein